MQCAQLRKSQLMLDLNPTRKPWRRQVERTCMCTVRNAANNIVFEYRTCSRVHSAPKLIQVKLKCGTSHRRNEFTPEGNNEGVFIMRTLTIGLMTAAGLAMAIPAALPANADSLSIGASPGGVSVGVRDHDRSDWREHYARDRDDAVVIREHARRCRVTVIHQDGMTKRIKRCD
jgi:hypothetical protein